MNTASPPLFDDRFVQVDDASAPLRARQIGLVPGAEVAVLTLDLPPALRGQAREQVARRQLLDRAGLDADTVDMRPLAMAAATKAEAAAWSKVLVTDGARLNIWRALAGTGARALMPDYLALPTAPDLWTVAQLGDNIAVRLGPQDGFTAPPDMAEKLLRAHLHTPPKAMLFLGGPGSQFTALADAHGIAAATRVDAVAALGVAVPLVMGHGEGSVNLLRNPQMARAALRRRVLPWRWPFLAGGLAAAVWSAAMVIETRQITAQTRVLQDQTLQAVRAAFIPEGPILDIRTQVSRALARQQTATDTSAAPASPLMLFGQASDVIARTSAALERVSTNADGVLTLILRVANFASADQVAQALRDAGLSVEIVQSRVSEGAAGVRSEMRVTRGAAP